LIVVTRNLS